MVALAVMRMPSTRISLTGGASVQTDTVEDGVMVCFVLNSEIND